MNLPRRENVPAIVSHLLDRQARWAPMDYLAGPYDGFRNTLEVFNVNADDQLSMMKKIQSERGDLESAIGGVLVVVFHTEARTRRIFPDGCPLIVMSGVFIYGDPSKAAVNLDIMPFSDDDAPRPVINGARMPLLEEEVAP